MPFASFFVPGGKGFYMRQPELTDFPLVAHWMALKTGLSGAELTHMEAVLAGALMEMAAVCQDYCVVGVYEGIPIFYLEMAGMGHYTLTVNPAHANRE